MALGVTLNVSSSNARSFTIQNRSLNSSIEKLAVGLGLARAKNDTASLAAVNRLTKDIKGLESAERNVGDGISSVQTAESGLSAVRGHLQRMRELAVEANNDTLSPTQKSAIQDEIAVLQDNISDIADGAEFNGINLLDGSAGSITIQNGPDANDTASIDLSGDFSADSGTGTGHLNEGNTGGSSGIAIGDIDVTTDDIDNVLTGIDNALENVSDAESTLGAKQNSFEAQLTSLSVKKESALATRSRIRDTNFAAEASVAIKSMILRDANASLSSQAHLNARLALGLLPT